MKTLLGAAGLAAATALTAPVLVGHANAQSFNDVYVFGDSLSDTGNLAAVIGSLPPPFSTIGSTTFSNGPTYPTYLQSELLGLEGTVTSFAFGGAFSGNGNIFGSVDAVLDTGLNAQVDRFLAGAPSFDANDVAVFLAGNNDYFALLPTLPLLSPADQQTAIINGTAAVVANMAGNANRLVASGARQILFVNLPNLGDTPWVAASGAAAIASGNQLAITNNGLLAQAAGQIGANSPATVYVADLNTLFSDMVANPGKYDLSNVTIPCQFVPGCLAAPVDVQNQSFFVDRVHPNTAAQLIAANFGADTLIAPRTIAAQSEFARFAASEFTRRLTHLSRHGAPENGGGERGRAFLDISYISTDRDSEPWTVGYEGDVARITGGLAAPFSEFVSAGIGIAYDTGNVNLDSGLGGFDFYSLRLGGYAGVDAGRLVASASGTFSFDDFDDIHRNTGVVGQIAQGDTEGSSFAAQGEVRYSLFNSDTFDVTPLARLVYSSSDVDSYSEEGAVGLNQRVFDHEADAFVGGIGAEITMDLGNDVYGLQPWFAGVYEKAFESDDQTIETTLITITNVVRSFESEGLDDSYFRLEGGINMTFRDRVAVQLSGAVITGRDHADAFSFGGRVAFLF